MKILDVLKRRRWLQITLICLVAAGVSTAYYAESTWPVDSYADCVDAGNLVLETDPPICRDGTHNFTGTPAPRPSVAPPVAGQSFETLVDGDTRAARPPHEQRFINSEEGWQAYWRDVHADLATLPPLIPVDFGTSSVVAVSLGQQATGGYGLKITSIETGDRGSVVSLTESTPTITCKVTQAVSNPYLIVRTGKLTPPVSFRISSEKRHC